MSTFGAGGVAKPFRSTNAAYEALKAWVLSAWKKHTELELPERTHKVMKEEEGLLHMAKKTIKDDPEDDEPHDIEFMTKPQRKINKHGNGTQCNEPTINNWDCFAKREWDECLTEDARIATVRDAYHVIHLKEVPETEVLHAACLEREELGLETSPRPTLGCSGWLMATVLEGIAGCDGRCHDVPPIGTVSPHADTVGDGGLEAEAESKGRTGAGAGPAAGREAERVADLLYVKEEHATGYPSKRERATERLPAPAIRFRGRWISSSTAYCLQLRLCFAIHLLQLTAPVLAVVLLQRELQSTSPLQAQHYAGGLKTIFEVVSIAAAD